MNSVENATAPQFPSYPQLVPFDRLFPSYSDLGQGALTARRYLHAIHPHWPLCPWEMRGDCRSVSCKFQMSTDYTIRGSEALNDLHQLSKK